MTINTRDILGGRNPDVYNPKAAGRPGFDVSSTPQNFTNFMDWSNYKYTQAYYRDDGRGTKGVDKRYEITGYYEWE